MGYSQWLVFSEDIVAVDSRAIIRTLSAAGTQSNTLCRTGCTLENLNEPMHSIIEGPLEQQLVADRDTGYYRSGNTNSLNFS